MPATAAAAQSSSPEISVVICAYADERRSELLEAIDSVKRQDPVAAEIIVVIDHNPGLEAALRDVVAGVRVIANCEAKGLSGARNSGIAAARGAIVAFIDDDAIAAPGWLREVGRSFAAPSVVGMGGTILPRWPGSPPRWLPPEFLWAVGCSYRGQPERLAEIRNPIGCNMAFRRDAFAAAGQFRTSMGRLGDNAAGDEETELSIRMRRALPGTRILFNPAAMVWHRIDQRRVSWRYFRARCLAEGHSKAQLVKLSGHEQGLSAERSYVARTLPAGALSGLADTLLRRDPWGLVRAGNIGAGLLFTACGYAMAWLRREDAGFRPRKVCDIDTDTPLAAIDLSLPGGGRYGGIFALLRKAGRPAAVIEVASETPVLEPAAVQRAIATAGLAEAAAPSPLTANAPHISVVIATRDRADSLARCLDTIVKQSYPAFDVTVVDNAPATAATAALIARRYAAAGVRYVREDIAGLGRAHNRGLEAARGAIIAFTDDDVLADAGWLQAIAGAFAADPGAGAVTGLILPAELETRAQLWTERHGGFGKGFTRKRFDADRNRPPDPLYPYTAGQFGSGANMAFRTSLLRQLGGFDPALGAGTFARGGDDLAAFVSVIKAGQAIIYEPAALVWHFHRRGEDGMRRQAFGYGVGLGAYLMKQAADDPAIIFTYLRLLPAGLMHLLAPGSEKNRRLPADYPAGLRWRERLGIVMGFPAYLVSRRQAARIRHDGGAQA